jgi:hypothetical protein
VDQRLNDGRVVHVGPDVHPVGLTVGPFEMACVGDGVEREALRLDQLFDGGPKPRGASRARRRGRGGAGRLFPEVWLASKTVATLKPRMTGVLVSGLSDTWLLPSAQCPHISSASRASLRVARRGAKTAYPCCPRSTLRPRARHVSNAEIISASARALDLPHALSHTERRSTSHVGRVVVQHGLEIENFRQSSPVTEGATPVASTSCAAAT